MKITTEFKINHDGHLSVADLEEVVDVLREKHPTGIVRIYQESGGDQRRETRPNTTFIVTEVTA